MPVTLKLRLWKALFRRKLGQCQAADAVRAARSLRDFDDVVTAPLHGFRDAADYYARSSAGQYLAGIDVETLLANALNDPFLPAAALPAAVRCPPR